MLITYCQPFHNLPARQGGLSSSEGRLPASEVRLTSIEGRLPSREAHLHKRSLIFYDLWRETHVEAVRGDVLRLKTTHDDGLPSSEGRLLSLAVHSEA